FAVELMNIRRQYLRVDGIALNGKLITAFCDGEAAQPQSMYALARERAQVFGKSLDTTAYSLRERGFQFVALAEQHLIAREFGLDACIGLAIGECLAQCSE